MGVLDTLKVNRSIATLLEGPSSGARLRAFATLKQLKARAVPKLIELLGRPESAEPAAEALRGLLDNGSLPLFYEGLKQAGGRVVHYLARLLSEPGRYNPNLLLDRLAEPDNPAAHLLDILMHQTAALDPRAVVHLIDRLDRDGRTPVFRLLDEVANEALVPDLVERTRSEDWLMRFNVVRILRRFHTPAVRDVLLGLLDDPQQSVRIAALEGLAGLRIPTDVGPIVRMLRDPDLTVQSKAIDTVSQIDDPSTVGHLLDLLQDESEYVRRAGVEVLNHIGNPSTVKELLEALRDRDWGVRVRAADALGTIGGPKVVEAMLSLLSDRDDFIRRSAIEVLNMTKDGRALDHLIKALSDEDWWVAERAADAIAQMGDQRAVPALLELMEQKPESSPAAIRALAALKDRRALRPVLGQLSSRKKAARTEALRALGVLTSEQDAELVQEAIRAHLSDGSDEFNALANQTLGTLVNRFGARTRVVERPAASSTVARAVQSLLEPAANALEPERDRAAPSRVIASGGDVPSFEPGTVLGGRYRMVRQVGSGGFGVVMLAQDTVVGEELVLKFLKPHIAGDESAVRRFIHEIRNARKVTHENVIRIYDFLDFGGVCAISMEYFPSHSLAAELAGQRLMDRPRALKILQEVCRGMIAAHQAGVVHRDLKPANVLIDDHDSVKICDFGLSAAGQVDSRLTTAGFLVGTPTYMAPEQVRGEPLDPRTDIYSLGVIMYEMFTGKPPYSADDPMAILFQHVEGKAVRASEVQLDISPALDSAILKAMAVEREWRYQNMEELRRDLAALLAEETS
jgi:HEAT repeat protein